MVADDAILSTSYNQYGFRKGSYDSIDIKRERIPIRFQPGHKCCVCEVKSFLDLIAYPRVWASKELSGLHI